MAIRKAESGNTPMQTMQTGATVKSEPQTLGTCVAATEVRIPKVKIGATLDKGRRAPKGRNYAQMRASKVDAFLRVHIPACTRLHQRFQFEIQEVLPALVEMERRYEKRPGARTDLHELKEKTWYGYLQSLGLNPSTVRSWKHRSATVTQIANIVDPPKPPVPVVQDINVRADELRRECESLKAKLAAVVESHAPLNPAITKKLIATFITASKDYAAFAEQLTKSLPVSTPGVCHQRIVRDQLAKHPELEPDLKEKQEAAADLKNASVRFITYEEAKQAILQNEYLGTMNASTQYSVGLFYKHPKSGKEFLGGVECFGAVSGTGVSKSICGEKHAKEVIVLVRGCCFHWGHKNAGSHLVSEACKLMAKEGYPIVCSFSDPAAFEVGTVLQAANFLYTGMTTETEKYRTPDGREHDCRQISGLTRDRRNGDLKYKRTRKQQKEILLSEGCEFFRGNGKHRYVLLSGSDTKKRELRKYLLPTRPYPKRVEQQDKGSVTATTVGANTGHNQQGELTWQSKPKQTGQSTSRLNPAPMRTSTVLESTPSATTNA